MDILVSFASRHGSTRGIAEAIAATLRAAGHTVAVRNAEDSTDAAAYAAVVLGSAIYNQAWLPEAAEFARRNARALAARPVWLFSVGALSSNQSWPLGALARREPKGIDQLLRTIRPRDYHVFAGAVAAEHLSLAGQVFFRLLKGRYGDYRNWQEINAWAESIARQLAASETAPTTPMAGTLTRHG